MSRSYKKNPIGKCAPTYATPRKRAANRKYRRCLSSRDMITGKSAFHRRYTDPWDIHDYVCRWTQADAESEWESEERQIFHGSKRPSDCRWHCRYKTKEQFINSWKSCMIRK